ncbi:MAG: sialidase family protein [Chloroflexota bacterium]
MPGAIEQISTSANGILKRRPQLAVATDGTVYAVWEENTEGSLSTNNGYNLYLAYRPAAGPWSAPVLIPATDRTRWPAGTFPYVNDWYPQIALDTSGNLHVSYTSRYLPSSGTTQTGLYYLVAKAANTGAPLWTTPMRVDIDANVLYHPDDNRIFVKSDGGATTDSTTYALWTGTSGSRTYLSRVQYSNIGHTTSLLDNPPLTNPGTAANSTPVSAGPVGINQIDTTNLQLVYASKNTPNGGNAIHTANFDTVSVTWSPASTFAGNLADGCSAAGCPGATTSRDGVLTSWFAANWDTASPSVHRIQVTMNNGASSSVFIEHAGLSTRAPVAVYESISDKLVVLYNSCTYVSSASCTGRDIWYRTFDGATWSSPVLLSPATGEQLDIVAVAPGQTVGGTNGAVHVAWQNQATSTNIHVQYQVIGITP